MELAERIALRDALADPTVPKSELDLHRTLRTLRRELESGGLTPGDFHDLAAVVSAQLGDHDAAVAHGRAALEAGRTVARQYDLGTALYQAGRLVEAKRCFDGLGGRHSSTALRVARASCALALGDRDGARELLSHAILRVNQEDPSDLFRILPALRAAGFDLEAQALFARYLCHVCGFDALAETDPLAVVAGAPTEVLERLEPIWPMDLRPLLAARPT